MAKNATTLAREMDRKKLSVRVRHQLLMESGYKCGNPTCRNIITLDIHHIEYVSDGGGDDPSNLLVLCPYCHGMHHARNIPVEAIRMWKGLLLALNQAFDRRSMELLLYLRETHGEEIEYSGDGLLQFAGLISAGLVRFDVKHHHALTPPTSAKLGSTNVFCHPVPHSPSMYAIVELTTKGSNLVDAWGAGDEQKFRELVSTPIENNRNGDG